MPGTPLPEIVLYSFGAARLEHTGVSGRYGQWVRVNGEEPNRNFVFARGNECLRYDRSLRRETRLFSPGPHSLYSIATSPDSRWIYFTTTIRDADLWLARLDR